MALSAAGAKTPTTLLYRIGFLSASNPSSLYDAFITGMRELEYQESRDYRIEARYAEGQLDRLPALAAELVELKVDVIVLGSIPSVLAAQRATKTVPIVVAAAGDLIGNRLVESLEQPGRNITGLDEVVPGLAGKRLRLLNEAFRLRSPVAILSSATTATHAKQMQGTDRPRHHWALGS